MRDPLVRFCAAIIAWLALTCFCDGANASSFKIIYEFQGGSDGAEPTASLINMNGTLSGGPLFEVTRRTVFELVIMTLLPFAPLLLTTYSFDQLLMGAINRLI